MRDTKTSGWTRAPALLLAGLLALGCGGGEQAASDTDAGAAGGPPEASIAPVGESGIQGTARLNRGGESLTLKLELLGVQEGQTYPASLVRGTCDSPGETVAELDTPHVGTVGVGSSLTELDPAQIQEGETYSIVVETPDGERGACGTLTSGGG